MYGIRVCAGKSYVSMKVALMTERFESEATYVEKQR